MIAVTEAKSEQIRQMASEGCSLTEIRNTCHVGQATIKQVTDGYAGISFTEAAMLAAATRQMNRQVSKRKTR